MTSKIFFLPVEERPKKYPPLINFKGRFWHTGIILDDKVYECFNYGKNSISNLDKLKNVEFSKAIYLNNVNVDENKIKSEINSGTDCAEYVARCTRLSKLEGKDKGNLYPEDIFKLLNK